MLDPFPIPYSRTLADWTVPYAEKFGLYSLPLHIHEVLIFFAIYTVVQLVGSPALSRRLCPDVYNGLPAKTRINWDIHVVSLVQSVFVCSTALWIMVFDEERKKMGGGSGVTGLAKTEFWSDAEKGIGEMAYWERVFAYTGGMGLVQAAGCGYFLWDLLVSARYVRMFGPGLLAHAVSAMIVFSFGFRPFLNYYAPTFLLYELSSPFLNVHWFCDKLNLTGSRIQLYNGFMLLGTFFACRLVYGSYQSFSVFYDIWRSYRQGPPAVSSIRAATSPTVRAIARPAIDANQELYMFVDASTQVPIWMAMAYLISNLTLNSLNWYWMGKMIETIRKRFPPPFGTMRVKAKAEQGGVVDVKVPNGGMATGVARGVYEDGHKSVEVEGLQVKQRPGVGRHPSEQVLIP